MIWFEFANFKFFLLKNFWVDKFNFNLINYLHFWIIKINKILNYLMLRHRLRNSVFLFPVLKDWTIFGRNIRVFFQNKKIDNFVKGFNSKVSKFELCSKSSSERRRARGFRSKASSKMCVSRWTVFSEHTSSKE